MGESKKYDVKAKKVVVVGLGRTAQALVRLLLREGAHPFVTESRDTEKHREGADELRRLGAKVETGSHTDACVDGVSVVIPSPGVAPSIAPVEQAVKAGAQLMSELEFASRYCNSRIIAITGTNGKTTTTELVTAMVKACGKSVCLTGNNATPFSAAVVQYPDVEYVVLEVSSYQLELIDAFRPWIGAVLNVTPDHLGRHGDFDRYLETKLRLFMNQGSGDHAVLNADDPNLPSRYKAKSGVSTHWFSAKKRLHDSLWVDGDAIRDGETEVAHIGDIQIPGQHNVQNVLAALAVMRAGSFDDLSTRRGLQAFQGVEHRIETVATIRNVTYVNDSKATNLASMQAALESFGRPVVLIVGGEGKGEDFSPYRALIAARVKSIVGMGRDGPLFAKAYGDVVPAQLVETMQQAIDTATSAASPGDIVLLSPGCASFDQYNNFEERGRDFKSRVLSIAEKS